MHYELRGGGNNTEANAFIPHFICDHKDILEILLFSTRENYLASVRLA